MIYLTGDTHGDIDFDKLVVFQEENELSYDDYLIIAGDFGGVWDMTSLYANILPYDKIPCTILFVDGNHENFDVLDAMPVEMWHGGKVHRVRDHIFHLMRGQVYEIDGKTFFTFGGATSTDKAARVEHIDWWSQEIPTEEEIEEGKRNLARYDNKVDYIITHSCDVRALNYPPVYGTYKARKIYPENEILSYFEAKVDYGHWYFGHYHVDGDLNFKKTAVYQRIIKLI